MPSLIEELQRDAIDRAVPVSDLLRKAKVVAMKLDLPDFLEWVDAELNGFAGDVPNYRIVTGQVQALNPMRGWIPISFESQEEYEALSKRGVASTAAELEQLLAGGKDTLSMSFSPAIEADLRKGIGFNLPFVLAVGRSHVAGILSSIRNLILDWSLKLEKAGVKGDGMSFSEKEKAIAHSAAVQITIQSAQNIAGNFAPVAGNVSINQTIGVDLQSVANLVAQMEKQLPGSGLEPKVEKRAMTLVADIKDAISQPKPDSGRVRELLTSLRHVMEDATGHLLAAGIISAIGTLLGGASSAH